MISFLIFLFFLYLIFKTFLSGLFFLYLWQLKEYRLDRFLTYLRIKEGQKQIFSSLNVFSLPSLRRPKFTLKTTAIFFLSLFFSFHFFFVFWQFFFNLFPSSSVKLALSSLLALISLNVFTLFLVSFLVFIFFPFTFLAQKLLVILAKQKLKRFPNLLVIGVTGSYGKSSTKDFLSTLLSTQFSVLKTQKTQNTEIAVALTILFNLKQGHQVFVVEMGAYKKGEIASICRIVKPKIGILTGINEQHQALFGSLENTIKAKNELINSLPKDGLAVLNADNSFCLKLARKTTVLKLLYSTKEKSDVFAKNVQLKKEKVSFDLQIDQKQAKIILNLCGRQAAQNFLAAAAVAHHLNISLGEISLRALEIKSSPGTMFPIKKKNFIVIDDSFSSNPDGFFNALDYLSTYKKTSKIIITTGIIELGRSAESIHHKLGEEIAQKADYLILTSENYKEALFAGAQQAGMKNEQLIFEKNPEKIKEILENLIKRKTIILIEGRIPDKLKKIIISN